MDQPVLCPTRFISPASRRFSGRTGGPGSIPPQGRPLTFPLRPGILRAHQTWFTDSRISQAQRLPPRVEYVANVIVVSAGQVASEFDVGRFEPATFPRGKAFSYRK